MYYFITLAHIDKEPKVLFGNQYEISDICYIRYSVNKLFGSISHKLSDSSSTSTVSSGGNKYQQKKRLCIIWSTKPFIQVLITATFGGLKLNDPNIVFGDLSREYVLKRVVPVYSKVAVNGRNPIKAERKDQGEVIMKNTYVLLIPVTVDENTKLYPSIPEFFPPKDWEYIIQQLLEISIDEAKEKSNIIAMKNHLSLSNNNKVIGDDSSESGSLPISRSSSNENFFLKQYRTRNWVEALEYRIED